MRHTKLSDDRVKQKFQFTHPGRGATWSPQRRWSYPQGFNSRTPGGVRRQSGGVDGCRPQVSIHAPREGCDYSRAVPKDVPIRFQFTHPGRGATVCIGYLIQIIAVSIHAPREGCDLDRREATALYDLVSIHAPREGCDFHHIIINSLWLSFNSRTPGGVRPDLVQLVEVHKHVSIHAPREGCDSFVRALFHEHTRFNSRTPGGVRLIHFQSFLRIG